MNRFSFSLLFLALFMITFSVKAQKLNKQDHLSVQKVIISLFNGMREGDSARVHLAFHDKTRMFTSYISKKGEQKLEEGLLSNFLIAVGTPHDQTWDEKIGNITIQLDEGLAQVWTSYSFYIGDKFSHCGVNAFQLVKDKDNDWKIINLIDTRRVTDCNTEH